MSSQTTGGSTGNPAFLQQRLATLGKVMFIVTMAGVFFRAAIDVSTDGPQALLEPDFAWNLAGNCAFGVLWLLCAGKERSETFVTSLEAAVLFIACTAYAVMGIYYRRAALGDYPDPAPGVLSFSHQYFSTIVLLTLTYAMAIRAAVIPSSARRTRWLTGLVGVPLVVIATHGYTPTPEGQSLLKPAVENITWWTFTVIICGVISNVIYGLRRKVIEARRLGQYTLEEKLGEGGMGMVYRASHAMLRRPTAIKLLKSEHVDAQDLLRFEREVRLTARLSHPNTITVFDYGRTPDDVFYYAMELLNGADLAVLVKSTGPQPPARVRHILARVADALSEAHDVGLIHRDIKPSNIILCSRGGKLDVPKVVDFGLVREMAQSPDVGLTGDGILVGTPLYMAPESLSEPAQGDGRSDLYALGAVGYYLLTGEHVFRRTKLLEVCWDHLHTVPIPPSERLGSPLPADLEALVLSCLAKAPEERPQSAAELYDRLLACSDAGPWSHEQAQEWWEESGHLVPMDEGAREDYPELVTSRARTMMFDLAGGTPED